MEQILVREYRPEDWARIELIHDSARKSELAHAGLSEAFVPLAQAAENEDLFEYAVFVAEAEGRVAGFVAYSEDEMAWLYVDPAAGGKGIGKALVRHAIESTKTRPLCAEVLVGNEPAIGLYTAMGFTIAETCSGQMPGNEAFSITAHRMLYGA